MRSPEDGAKERIDQKFGRLRLGGDCGWERDLVDSIRTLKTWKEFTEIDSALHDLLTMYRNPSTHESYLRYKRLIELWRYLKQQSENVELSGIPEVTSSSWHQFIDDSLQNLCVKKG